jgi:hypothetical protein
MSTARGRDNKGSNDNHSIAMAALVEYPNLWCTNLYAGGGDGLASLLGSSPGQYPSLYWNLLVGGTGCTKVAGAVATACKMAIKHSQW